MTENPTTKKFEVKRRGKKSKTRYTSIYQHEHLDGKDITYSAMYRKNGKLIEDKIGKKSEGWSARSASEERTLRMKGLKETNNERKERLKTEQTTNSNRMTFRNLLEEYLSSKPNLRSSKKIIYNFNKHSAEIIGDKLPEELMHRDIEEIRSKLIKAYAKPMTVFHTLELIKRLANFGFKRKLCANINFHIELPTVHNKTTEFLNSDELNRLIAVLNKEPEPVHNFFMLILQTGLRRDELQTLRWSDIQFQRKLMTISPENAKSGREEFIYLNDAALEILQRQWSIKEQRKPEVAAQDLVFFTINGNVWGKSQSAITKIYKRIHEAAELPKSFRMAHGLRHQFGGMHANAGTPPLVLQKLMQHKELRTTQRYIEIEEKTLRDVAERTSELIEKHLRSDVIDLNTGIK